MWTVILTYRSGGSDRFRLGSGEAHQLFEVLVGIVDREKVERLALENPKGVMMNEVLV